jgi:hypothetical protein
MKAFFLAVICLIIGCGSASAQSHTEKSDDPRPSYKLAHLETLSIEELDTLYTRALKTKRNGFIMFTTGIVVGGASYFGILASMGELEFLAFPFLVGTVIGLIGIPVWITGGSRSRRISAQLDLRNSTIHFDICPIIEFNPVNNINSAGICLTVRF